MFYLAISISIVYYSSFHYHTINRGLFCTKTTFVNFYLRLLVCNEGMHCGGKRKQFFVFQLANFYQVTSNHLGFRPTPRVLFERPFIDMLRITVNVLLYVISLFGPLPNSCTLSHVHHEHNDGIYCSWSNYALRWCKAPIIILPNPTALQSKIRLPVQIDVMAFDFSCKSCSAYFDCALIPVCWCNLL